MRSHWAERHQLKLFLGAAVAVALITAWGM